MNAADELTDAASSVSEWAQQPFALDMDLLHWGLFTGLVVIAAIMWMQVLHTIKGEI